ncbi:hypothetical protein DICPUDRAFT_154833 [Dictyostelium purpureum]|uniref:Uncharacterized protein n=1 Tax=Dictyostelium purpureum TaxID=5786 RepID=F0ZSD9_DICPU|nr:uncharacterized protein DICPUDRAFT_154833 [Dictyostelium purpureum]EGC33143.1 hypothetical protein DICPUDRAFT_154833 [Dictyostelium purpureum]|eukprot:XP_003290338.1 hypothetical protein DICPUDRAFT_154833 [Dictyostelium purpureum]
MDTVRVNYGLDGFELTYPSSFKGAIEPTEFETTIRTLNSKVGEIKIPKISYIFVIPLLVGIIMLFMYMNENQTKTVIGGIIMSIGLVGGAFFSIQHAVAVNSRLNGEIKTINEHFSERRISWSVKSETIYEEVDIDEYEFHKSNKAYRNSLSFDHKGKPMKKKTRKYLLITFPAQTQQTQQDLPQFTFIPDSGNMNNIYDSNINNMDYNNNFNNNNFNNMNFTNNNNNNFNNNYH